MMYADFSGVMVETKVARKRPSRALLFVLLWLTALSLPMLSYHEAAQQDDAAATEAASAPN